MKNEFYPTSETAYSALKVHSLRIKRSIHHLLSVMQNDAGFEDPHLELAVETASKAVGFQPETHFYHGKLISSMKEQDRPAAEGICKNLIRSILDTRDGNPFCIATIGTDHWEGDVLGRAIQAASAESGLTARAMPVAPDAIGPEQANLRAGLNMLAAYHPSMHSELETLVRSIKLFTGRVTQGLTDTQVFGEIYVRIPRRCVDPVPYYVEHTVHETAHTYLNCLMASDPIVLNSADDRFPSPLRTDLRPMYAVYHATFVAARMALTFKIIFENTGESRWVKLLAEVSDETVRGFETIRNSGDLTARGKAIMIHIKYLLKQIAEMSVWRDFDFNKIQPHRCGAGVAQYSNLKSFLHSQ